MTLTKLSLFSGIGGDDLASDWAGIKTVCFVEKDKFCQQILAKHWPDIPIIEDVKDVTNTTVKQNWRLFLAKLSPDIRASCERRGIDIISGGFPCQPHSVAGKRKASSDDRDLWPEFRRVIGEIKPRWVVAENVPGLFSGDAGRFFGGILYDLAALGYVVGWCCFGAVDVGALHRRDRVFIVAHAGCAERGQKDEARRRVIKGEYAERQATSGLGKCSQDICHSPIAGLPDWAGGKMGQPSPLTEFERPDGEDVADSEELYGDASGNNAGSGSEGRRKVPELGNGSGTKGKADREIECDFRGIPHGIPRRVDRLRSLGNAVVPQQIYPIYKAIVETEQL